MVVKIVDNCKMCTKCKVNRDVSLYGSCKKTKCNLQAQCKICKNEYEKERRLKNPEYFKNYYENNKEIWVKRSSENKDIRNEWVRIDRKNNPEKYKIALKKYLEENPEKRGRHKRYRSKNPEKCKLAQKKYRENNLQKCLKKCRDYKAKNRKQINKTGRVWLNKRRKENPKYRITESISGGIRRAIFKNGTTWTKLVPYTREDLINHLESKFTKGMTWDNYGIKGWVLDHRVPQVYFKFNSTDHPAFKACWALENLQPLWNTTKIAISYGEDSTYVGNSDKQHRIEITPEIKEFLNKVNGENNGEGQKEYN